MLVWSQLVDGGISIDIFCLIRSFDNPLTEMARDNSGTSICRWYLWFPSWGLSVASFNFRTRKTRVSFGLDRHVLTGDLSLQCLPFLIIQLFSKLNPMVFTIKTPFVAFKLHHDILLHHWWNARPWISRPPLLWPHGKHTAVRLPKHRIPTWKSWSGSPT